jgi:hypothetical protein
MTCFAANRPTGQPAGWADEETSGSRDSAASWPVGQLAGGPDCHA